MNLVEEYRKDVGKFIVVKCDEYGRAEGILKDVTSENILIICGSGGYKWHIDLKKIKLKYYFSRPDRFKRGDSNISR